MRDWIDACASSSVGVAGEAQERRVDLLVELEVLEPVAHRVALDHPVVQRRTSAMSASLATRQASRAANASSTASTSSMSRTSFAREAPHDRAARRDELDQPFAREELERLAQRRARHAELRAELAFVDARARAAARPR